MELHSSTQLEPDTPTRPDSEYPSSPQANDTPSFAPPLHRSSLRPAPWGELNPLQRWADATRRRLDHGHHDEPPWKAHADPAPAWRQSARLRRTTLALLAVLQTGLATWFMQEVMPYHGTKPLELAMLVLFAVLFMWVSIGFWTAMAGFVALLRGGDRHLMSRAAAGNEAIPDAARTAIVMPICNEDVARVFAGLRATYESVARSGNAAHFDFFILSDSNRADTLAAELAAWHQLKHALGREARIFYRHRRRRTKRKSGNIDDFCRRWGADYRYMVVLDADSVMSGDCLSNLVRLMEKHPHAGIIQTAPLAAGRDTLYARVQQFSTRVYGALFTAGLHYWQLGESLYWGHNAIIRMQPFLQHCILAPLPGEGIFAGHILSHDFIEAALMRRAGYSVWIAYDLPGSYEETPPNLLDELGRDRRWCQGNLMNFRLFMAPGLNVVHRLNLAMGVMAYLSAPLWFLFLVLSTALLATHTLMEPQYFVQPGQLFPIWPEWHPEKAVALFTATTTLLFLPKILSVLLIASGRNEKTRRFGGRLRLTISMLIEAVFSMLLAPVRMLFHTRFVLNAFLGWSAGWKSPQRADNDTDWSEACRRHAFDTLLGIAWTTLIYSLSPAFLWWWLPITAPLALSIPLSVLLSKPSFGIAARKLGLFLIPEEAQIVPELMATKVYAHNMPPLPGFIEAVVDPGCTALAWAHARKRPAQGLEPALRRGLHEGPEGLSPTERLGLLDHAPSLARLHLDVRRSPQAHKSWGVSFAREGG